LDKNEGGEFKMTENQKDTQKECRAFFERMPFAKMMKKMTGPKGGCCDFSCSEMMSQMMKMCSRGQTEKEEAAPETKEEQKANP
jgi:hypothetical protein